MPHSHAAGTVEFVIGYLHGTACADNVVLTSGGVGYVVITAHPLTIGDTYNLWIHTVVSETAIACYGFDTVEARDLFLALLKTPGVGGRTACEIVASDTPTNVAGRLSAGDVAWLQTVKGIGKSTAAKIIATVTIPAHLSAATPTPGTAIRGASPPSPAVTTGDDIADTLIELTGANAADALSVVYKLREQHPGISEDDLIRHGLTALRKDF